ncbi:hypothetical protein R83H12_01077 [Fibrobacteria bacterium R8-3-H12]
MPKSYILLNHTLTDKQKRELKEIFGASDIILPPQEISDFWQQIPTDAEISEELLEPILKWLLTAKNGDILVIQGEFGSTFAIADWALGRGLTALHSVTERVATESRDGEVVQRSYVFEHVRFRKFVYLETEA